MGSTGARRSWSSRSSWQTTTTPSPAPQQAPQQPQSQAATNRGTKIAGNTDSEILDNFSTMSEQDQVNFIRNEVDNMNWSRLRGLNNNETQKMVEALGLHDKPMVLSDADFDATFKANAVDGVYMFRGVRGNQGLSPKQIVDSVKFGDKTFIGDGVHGDGIYLTTSYNYADGYASTKSGLMQAYLDKSKARVVEEQAIHLMKQMETNPRLKSLNTGAYALYKGFNVVKSTGGNSSVRSGRKQGGGQDFYIVLSREPLVIRDTVRMPSRRK